MAYPLIGFKRLMELAAGTGVVLSVLLIGNPKLRNDLRRPQMEEIGYRTTTFEFEGVSGLSRVNLNHVVSDNQRHNQWLHYAGLGRRPSSPSPP